MTTTYYLRDSAATGVKPTTKQSADTINRDVATVYATYAAPADMLTTMGTVTRTSSSTAAEPGAPHYTHYGTWISPPLGAQTLSGTCTVALGMREGDATVDAFARVKIYKWLANDTFGSDILPLTTSALEINGYGSYAGSPQLFFNAVNITSTTFASGDRIVIEVESFDNNSLVASWYHGIHFNNNTGGYVNYLAFSQDIIHQGDVAASPTTTKALGFFVANTASAQTKALGFFVKTTKPAVTKQLGYGITAGSTRLVLKQIGYVIKAPRTIACNLGYSIQFGSVVFLESTMSPVRTLSSRIS